MKNLILTIMAIASILSANADIVQVQSVEPLLKGVESGMYYPVLSVNGNLLLFSKSDYTGLRLYDFNDNVTISVSDEPRAGLNASFSPDERQIYFVTQNASSGKNMRQAKRYDISAKQTVAITEMGRLVSKPMATKNGVSVAVDGTLVSSDKMQTTVRTEGSKLFITQGGIEQSYTPVPSDAGYLWASLSPDGSKVMFFAAGKGIIITDLNGNILSQLGKYEAPVWYGNDCIVAMNATDDGHQYQSSQIVFLRADGSEMQELTRPESMTMFPTASETAGKIVYNTIDGCLYVMNVKLN